MKQKHIAIVGATGAVGQEMVKVLIERKFPYQSLRLFASKQSAGKQLHILNHTFTIEAFDQHCLDHVDIVFGATDSEIAKEIAKQTKRNHALFIDNSAAFRLDKDVPLIIPEVNADDMHKHHGIIANPNCATILALTALYPLHAYATIQRLIVSTYQAVSGAGNHGIHELQQQIHAIASNKPIQTQTFPYQIAFNLIPKIGSFYPNGYTQEELKLEKESKKILHDTSLLVNCTCVRVPVIRSHSESIYVEFKKPLDISKAQQLLKHAKGIKFLDQLDTNQYPMPLDTSNQDLVYVGRLRKDPNPNVHALSLWCCGDQLRKGAATNAIQIAELAIQ